MQFLNGTVGVPLLYDVLLDLLSDDKPPVLSSWITPEETRAENHFIKLSIHLCRAKLNIITTNHIQQIM